MSKQANVDNNFERVVGLISTMPQQRKKLVSAMMEKIGESYFTSPASTRTAYHHCFPGGLAQHSLEVFDNLVKIVDALARGKYPEHKLAFVALFHDLGKVGDGENEFYVHKDSDWHIKQGIRYDINSKCIHMPNSERGLFILQKFGIVVDEDEWLAIRLNDGQYDEGNRYFRMREPQLALFVHWADMLSVSNDKANCDSGDSSKSS